MQCQAVGCDKSATKLVTVRIAGRPEDELPRCDEHTSNNDSYRTIGGK